ncbi:DUF996 domain-containing protein [Thermoplasmatota archaeon]
MVELSNIKTIGKVGALLTLLGGFIPFIGPIIGIVGFVLVLIAVKSISELVKDKDIFKNYLIDFILSIISIVMILVIMLIGFINVGGFSWLTSLQDINIQDLSTFWDFFGGIIEYAIMALIVGWILWVIGAIYLRRSYNSIAKHTNVSLFRTTGTVYLIGALTTIILIGFVILFVGRIIEVIAYFSLPDELPTDNIKEKSEMLS